MKNPLILLTLLAITGCAATTRETILRNDAGEERYCYLVIDNFGLVGVAGQYTYTKCLNEAGTDGFKRTDTK